MDSLEDTHNMAKMDLISLPSTTFIASILFSLKTKFNSTVNRAQTNGIELQINPDWYMTLTRGQRVFLLAHEAWHVAFQHMLRGKELKHEMYNRAADYVINIMLKEAKHEMIENTCLDAMYSGWSTDEVYTHLESQPEPPKQDGLGKDIDFSDLEDPEKQAEADVKVQQSIVNAHTQATMCNDVGSIPGEIKRAIEELINPVLPWGVILQRYLNDLVKEDYTWRRPNRRYMPDFYLPSQCSEAIENITIAIDTSGSISKDDLRAILSEIQYIRDTMHPKVLTIMDCDLKIHNVYEVLPDDNILDLKFTGGGGSACYPVFKYLEEHPPTIFLYFTDLYFLRHYPTPVDYPVLWIVYNNPIPKNIIGEVIKYN